MDITRRGLLCGLGGLAVASAIPSIVTPAEAAGASKKKQEKKEEAPKGGRFAQVNGEFGWTPHKLDVKEVMDVAYEGYWYKGYACGYGAFYAIVGLLGEKYGAPYNQFPFAMLEANKGGISDWGTICGALYGVAAAYALFWGRKERNAMVHEVYRWYETTALPIYNPGDKAKVKGDLPKSVSGSVLCHLSVSKWCAANKIDAKSKQRSERCGRLTADVAGKAVEVFNAKIDLGKDWKGTYPVQAAVSACGECHGKKGTEWDWAKGVMDCKPCHSGSAPLLDKFKNHP